MAKKFSKILCLLLCLITVATLLAACKKDPTVDDKPKETEAQDDPNSNLDENGYEKDSITEKLDGRTVKMLIYTEGKDSIFPEKSTEGADLIVDTVYSRNLDLEDRLDVVFDLTYEQGGWSFRTSFMEVAEKCGENEIDVVASYSLWPSLMAQRGLITNLKNLTYPELEKPWWPDAISDYEQNGALYYVHNNSSLMGLKAMVVVYANSKMIEGYGLTDPTELVVEKKWTLDTMLTYAKNIAADSDLSYEDRTFGLVVDDHSRVEALLHGAGIKLVEKNSNGEAQLSFTKQASKQKVSSLIDKLGSVAAYDNFTILQATFEPLSESRTMFFVASMDRVVVLGDNKDYSVIPAPMYDEAQGQYYVMQNNNFDVWCIPTQAEDKEASGVVIEAFASSDYRTLAPYYYDENLKYRYSDSSIGVEVFEIIRQSVKCDFGRITAASFGILEQAFRDCFWDYSAKKVAFKNQYTTKLAGNATTYSITLSDMLKEYAKYADR